MQKLPFSLSSEEQIILVSNNVNLHENAPSGQYGDLYLTNLSIVAASRGFGGTVKEIRRFNLKHVSSVSTPYENESTLVIHYIDSVYYFTFTQNEMHELKIWPMAIHDMMSSNKNHYDYEYYKGLYKIKPNKITDRPFFSADGVDYDKKFIRDMAVSLIFSKDLSYKGFRKSHKKAVKKQSHRKFFNKIIDSEIVNSFKDEFLTSDIEDYAAEFNYDIKKVRKLYAEREKTKKDNFEAAFSEATKNHRNQSNTSVTHDYKIEEKRNPIVNNRPTDTTLINIAPRSQLSSLHCVGKDYKEIEKAFRSAGFYNIIVVPKEKPHRLLDRFKKYPNGSVFSVSIDGSRHYIPGNYSPSDPITITYYTDTFPDDSEY